MLSRVAAVEAPRTHNRRRVTGSSGRMREGRESERQRPNMSRHLFFSAVLLLVVMVCCGSGGAVEVGGEPSESTFKWRGINEGETVESLGAPSLLKVGNDVFAVAEAQCKKGGGKSFTGIASQLLTTKTADTPEELFSDALKKTQVLEEDASKDEKKEVDVSRPTTAVRGSDIYMLVGQYGSKDSLNSGAGGCGLLLVRGSVSGEVANKKIDWEDTESSPQRLLDAQLDSWTKLIGSGGSGVNLKDETLVFPVEGTKKKENDDAEEDVKTVSLIISSSKDTTDWTLSKGMSDGGCSAPSVVEWEEGKLMMMTACGDGSRRVYETVDKGNTWTEALGTLSRVWGSNQEGSEKAVGSGFITATFGNDERDVMLVTLPVYPKEEGNSKGKLHLWLTDNTHIVDIGSVSGDDEDVAASSLLYKSVTSGTDEEKKEELVALYEKKKGGDDVTPHSLLTVTLNKQLERVKEVLTTWKEVDERVSKLCTTLFAGKVTSPDTACTTDVKVTDGLVGFLSGKFSDNVWRDEYLGVNATVNDNGATNTSDGVTFHGAWAEWPVGKQGENQLYHFANYNFTLVATVSIHNEPTKEGNIPLLGVRAGSNGENKLMELSYDKEKKWHLLCGDGTSKELSSTWETGTPQHVVLLIQNGTQGSAYVDGQRVGNGECALGNGESKEISHFYIGGDGENKESREELSVTVTNVLLYNRPWDEVEIAAFNPNKDPTPSPVNAPSQGTAIQPSGGGKEEQGQSLGSSGVNGVSAPTVSSAKASSGGEGPATQLVSQESSDGSKSVGGASSPGSDAAVGTRDRSTVQGDGSSQTPMGTPTTADTNAPNAEDMGHDGTAVTADVSVSSGADGQKEEVNTQFGDVKAAALSSSLGNVSHGNNTDAGSVCGSGLLPLLLFLLGLWGFAAA
ncbi:trans-sialidase [Trypanosoma cruzi Dm28c]|uniref:Trans-sialidase n=2 Tax=Trypanosoma cruzi TaxID=5693 RepID=V5AU58_TRYCR|nr:trans-sialidase [Trypanosoma cruzi Dm28c]PBJ76432.1 trans-sialidase [Trypanosoma cruzi cruzi]PWU99800.1 putative trans-sialidase, Group V [Trypanosoma cruzi]